MKKFFTEWWDIQREERSMEGAYMQKHWKGVILLNASLIAIPIAVVITYGKIKDKQMEKRMKKISEDEES